MNSGKLYGIFTEERVQNVSFSRFLLCGYVRCSVDGRPGEGLSVTKRLRFQIYPA